MKLIIGGYAQGKLRYVLQTYDTEDMQVLDGEIPENPEEKAVVNHLHTWIKKRMLVGGNPEAELFKMLERCPQCILISDEIGSGIVPLEAWEREYREQTGRILTSLAQKADSVERVFCGLAQKLK